MRISEGDRVFNNARHSSFFHAQPLFYQVRTTNPVLSLFRHFIDKTSVVGVIA